MEFTEFNGKMNRSIQNLLKTLLKQSFKNPSQAGFIAKMAAVQKKSAQRRQLYESQGLHVPAFMIASITKRCNLHCKGCYAHAKNIEASMDTRHERLKSLVGEARDLGISIIMLAGGEPLLRKQEIIEIAKTYDDVLFPMFTNGLLIDEELIEVLKSTRNIVPIISIEGLKEKTDNRRGEGVYHKLRLLFNKLKQNHLFYGASITATSDNLEEITEEGFVRSLIEDGCKLFFYTEYVPVEKDTDGLILKDEQRDTLMMRLNEFSRVQPAFFIAFPGDEKNYGGCIASGRGFIHVSPEGSVEPCPFAPFSDSNIHDKSLKECIQSDFLSKIRQNHDLLTEGQGGCALWEKRELVQSFLEKK